MKAREGAMERRGKEGRKEKKGKNYMRRGDIVGTYNVF